jgi:mannose-6-phosphate isomerase
MQKNNKEINNSGANIVGEIYHRPWGTYQTLALHNGFQVKIIKVNPQGKLSLQKHAKRAEHWVVVQGQPTITVDDDVRTYRVNDRVYIPIGSLHRMENAGTEDAVIIEVQIGEYLGEDDIVRLDDIYGR